MMRMRLAGRPTSRNNSIITAVAVELALNASLMLLVSQYSGVTEFLLRL